MAATKYSDPYLDDGMRGFIVNTARKNFWRVPEWYALEDLIQDGYACFYKCKNYYRDHKDVKGVATPNKDQRRWFMALVRTTYFNHIFTLAAKYHAVPERAISQMGSETSTTTAVWEKLFEPTPEEGTLRTLLASAPAEIKQVLQLLAGDSADAIKYLRIRSKRRRIRETTNEYLCRLAGLDPKERDFVGELRTYFR